MGNTITNTTVISGSRKQVVYCTLSSDGSNETDYTLYDASVLSSPATTKCVLLQAWASISTAATARVFLEWDATTDVLALDLPPGRYSYMDFRHIGGLKNTGGTGITGDINLTTAGLASGDKITIVLELLSQ